MGTNHICLLIFSFGISLTIQADIGVTPWDALGIGLTYHTPFNYEIAMTLVSIFILILDLCLKKSIGFGTMIDALLTGNLIHFYVTHLSLQPVNLMISIIMMIEWLLIASFGQYFYIEATQECGPRDTLLLGLKKMNQLSVGTVQVIIYATV